jgi:hypothetical protein
LHPTTFVDALYRAADRPSKKARTDSGSGRGRGRGRGGRASGKRGRKSGPPPASPPQPDAKLADAEDGDPHYYVDRITDYKFDDIRSVLCFCLVCVLAYNLILIVSLILPVLLIYFVLFYFIFLGLLGDF